MSLVGELGLRKGVHTCTPKGLNVNWMDACYFAVKEPYLAALKNILPTRRTQLLTVTVADSAIILLSWLEIVVRPPAEESGPIISVPLFLSMVIGVTLILPLLFDKLTPSQTFVSMLIPLALIAVIPALLGTSPLQPHTFQEFSDAIQVKNSGHINAAIYPFEAWPIWAILGSFIMLLTGSNDAGAITVTFPVLVDVLVIILIAGMTRYYRSADRSNVLLWSIVGALFILVNFTEVNAFLPQGIAMILFLILVGFVICRRGALARSDNLVVLILFFGIVMSHLFTSLIALVFIALATLRLPLIEKKGAVNILKRSIVTPVVLVFAVWNVSFAIDTVRLSLPIALQILRANILNSLLYYATYYGGKATGPIYESVAVSREALAALLGLFAVMGLGIWLFSKNRENSGSILLRALFATFAGVLTVVSGATAGYLLRIYGLSIFPVSYFASHLLKNRRTLALVLIVMIVLVPLHFYTIYGMQNWDHLDNTYLTGLSYFDSQTVTGTVIEIQYPYYGDPLPFGYFNEPNTYSVISHQPADPTVLSKLASNPYPAPAYFITTKLTAAVYTYVAGSNQPLQNTTVWLNAHLDRIYDNGGVTIWSSG